MSSLIPQKIKEKRILAGLTQTELAEKLGIGLRQMQRYEKNILPNNETFRELSRVLKYDFHKLLGYDTISHIDDLANTHAEENGDSNNEKKENHNNTSLQIILTLSESHKCLTAANEELSRANRVLSENNTRLLDQYITANALARIPEASQSRLREALELLSDVGPGKRFFSEEEAWANVVRVWGNLDSQNLKRGIQSEKGTGHK